MYDIDEICKKVNGVFSKKISLKISRISSLKSAKKNEISFFSHLKYFDDLKQSKASVFLVSNSLKNKVDSLDLNFIFVKDITIATNAIIDMFMSKNENYEIDHNNEFTENFVKGKNCFIDSFVKINSNSKIGNNVKILSNCHIGKNVTIGDNSVIYSGVKIYDNSVIGENNIIHSNAVIGSDGFGFAFENKTLQKVKHIGNVITGKHVEIGANTCIDRSTFDSTVISDFVKIDNLVQIGHNVEIGSYTMIAGNVAIAGSTKIGKSCLIGGNSSIAGHLKIGDNVKIAGHSGIGSNINSDSIVQSSLFAYDLKKFQRSNVLFKRLPEIVKKIENIEKKIESKDNQ